MKPLILTLIIAVIATTIGAGWVITQLHTRLYSSNPDTDKNLIAYKQLGKAIGLSLNEFNHREEFVSHWNETASIDIQFQDRSGFPVPNDIKDAFNSGEPLLLESEGELSLHLYLPKTNQVMSMLSPIAGSNRSTLLNLILTLLFYLVVIAVLLAWLYPLIKRLVILQKAANQLGTGDLTSRVSLSKFSYIASIETAFNRMANQIQKLVGDNQLLSRAVSHNLKTPITRLRMGVDVLEEATDKSEFDRYIKRINTDLDEMQSLVETLLQYSSLDEFQLRLKNEPIDLCQFIPNLIENEKTTDIKIAVHFSNDSVIIETDPQYLAMSLVNIISNAVQHAKSIIDVKVDLKCHDKKETTVSVIVEDDGVGILESDLVHITKPFWRGRSNPGSKGHGMGLAIAERVSTWLKADLIIGKSASLGGASISMVFVRQ